MMGISVDLDFGRPRLSPKVSASSGGAELASDVFWLSTRGLFGLLLFLQQHRRRLADKQLVTAVAEAIPEDDILPSTLGLGQPCKLFGIPEKRWRQNPRLDCIAPLSKK